MPTSGTWKAPYPGRSAVGHYESLSSADGRLARVVPPFSVQSRQRDVKVAAPPKCGSTRARSAPGPTTFRR